MSPRILRAPPVSSGGRLTGETKVSGGTYESGGRLPMKLPASFFALVTLAHGLKTLLQGPGLAQGFPGDRGLSGHPAVLWTEGLECLPRPNVRVRLDDIPLATEPIGPIHQP